MCKAFSSRSVNSATARVLAAEGFDVVVPEAQGCCGALSWHAGRQGRRPPGKETVDAFKSAGVEHVVVNAAGCGSAMKEYALLLADEPWLSRTPPVAVCHTRDFSELLAVGRARAERHPVK